MQTTQQKFRGCLLAMAGAYSGEATANSQWLQPLDLP